MTRPITKKQAVDSRKPITERMKIDALLHIAFFADADDAYPFVCAICHAPIYPTETIDWDHAQPLSRGGKHMYTNIRPLHRECHKKKTFRPRGGATTLGGDNYEAKKTARLEQKVAGTWQISKPKRPWPKRKMAQRKDAWGREYRARQAS